MTWDGGVVVLAAAERGPCLCDRLMMLIADRCGSSWVVHFVADILRARILAVAGGDEDAGDRDLACGRLPDSARDLCSQPTMSRRETAPSLREMIRRTRAMVDLYCTSDRRPR